MDLSTTYLGLKLAHPLMPGPLPSSTKIDVVKRSRRRSADRHALPVRGADAREQVATFVTPRPTLFLREALTYFPSPESFVLDRGVLEQIRRIKAPSMPGDRLLNGTSLGGCSPTPGSAGGRADAIEPTCTPSPPIPTSTPYLENARCRWSRAEAFGQVRSRSSVALLQLARELREPSDKAASTLGAVQPFLPTGDRRRGASVRRQLHLSTSSSCRSAARLPSCGKVKASLGAAGVHTASTYPGLDGGANAVQVVSALLSAAGVPERAAARARAWLEKHEYDRSRRCAVR